MSENPAITDSHCHLDFPDFDGQQAQIIENALAAGVTRMVTICTRMDAEPKVRAIAETHAPVFYAAGVHPMRAHEEPLVPADMLIDLSQHPKFVGIGETGLDYHYTAETAQVQQDSLRNHIAAARETGLPLIIHARAADDDMARILAEEYRNGAYSCVMHCFSSSAELARASLDLGFYLSMSGIAAFPKSQELRDIFAAAPVDRKPARDAALSFTERHRLAELPGVIDRLGAEIAKLEQFLSQPDLYAKEPVKFAKGTEALADRQRALAAAEEEWMMLEEKAEAS